MQSTAAHLTETKTVYYFGRTQGCGTTVQSTLSVAKSVTLQAQCANRGSPATTKILSLLDGSVQDFSFRGLFIWRAVVSFFVFLCVSV